MITLCLICLCFAETNPQLTTPDASSILAASDQARGGGLPGISWQVEVTSVGAQTEDSQFLINVQATGDNSLITFLEPAKNKGRKMLMQGRNMWFSRPGLRKAVPISPRQRLSGQASNSDIASTNYARDYTPSLSAEEELDGEPCYVLELKAARKNVTYGLIRYWVSKNTGLGVKAEFYTEAGRLLKSAEFEYQNSISFEGKQIPFVSQMVIRDALNSSQQTTLAYADIVVEAIPANVFRIN